MIAGFAIWANQYILVYFFHVFLPHMVPYGKFILIAVGGKCWSAIFVLSFHLGSAVNTQALEML